MTDTVDRLLSCNCSAYCQSNGTCYSGQSCCRGRTGPQCRRHPRQLLGGGRRIANQVSCRPADRSEPTATGPVRHAIHQSLAAFISSACCSPGGVALATRAARGAAYLRLRWRRHGRGQWRGGRSPGAAARRFRDRARGVGRCGLGRRNLLHLPLNVRRGLLDNRLDHLIALHRRGQRRRLNRPLLRNRGGNVLERFSRGFRSFGCRRFR